MLPSLHRIKKTEFALLKKNKFKIFSSDGFTIKIYFLFEKDFVKFAVVVPVSFSKKAVERNKAKRQIRAIVSASLNDIKNNLAIIIYPKKKIQIFEEAEKELTLLFEKAKILRRQEDKKVK